MYKKYEITAEEKTIFGRRVHRIRALRGINNGYRIRKGELGGWIENESNLSQEGDCWVGGNACVFEGACVKDNAFVCGSAVIRGDALIKDESEIYRSCRIYSGIVKGHAIISDYATVRGGVIRDYSIVSDHAIIADNAIISDNARVKGHAAVFQRGKIGGDMLIDGYSIIRGNAAIKGHSYIHCGHISNDRQWLQVPLWDGYEMEYVMFTSNRGDICFNTEHAAGSYDFFMGIVDCYADNAATSDDEPKIRDLALAMAKYAQCYLDTTQYRGNSFNY
jgi:carbonic anhydrase/acetyltransferase-like protein (isoleucine patch superfamily)